MFFSIRNALVVTLTVELVVVDPLHEARDAVVVVVGVDAARLLDLLRACAVHSQLAVCNNTKSVMTYLSRCSSSVP